MELPGHVGVALLLAAPAWFVFERRLRPASFTAFVVTTAMLPDVDLVLRRFLPVHHHGVTHTFVFVAAMAAVLAGVVALAVDRLPEFRETLDDAQVPTRNVFGFALLGFLLGGVSHVLADMLSAPDIAQPIEPFWPLGAEVVAFEVFYYSSPLANYGLLAVGLAAQVAAVFLRDGSPFAARGPA